MQLHVRYGLGALGCVMAMGLVSTGFAGSFGWGLTKSHPVPVNSNQQGLVFTIAAQNQLPTTINLNGTATVTLTDTLPAGLTAINIQGTGWNCTLATLTCTRNDDLAPNALYPSIFLTVNVGPITGTLVNVAAITISDGSVTDKSVNDNVVITLPVSLQSFDVR